MSTIPTVHVTDTGALELHIPRPHPVPPHDGSGLPYPGPHAVILDPTGRVMLTWATCTTTPGRLRLDEHPFGDPICLSLCPDPIDPAGGLSTHVDGISYDAPQTATAAQIAAELNARIPAALDWAAAQD